MWKARKTESSVSALPTYLGNRYRRASNMNITRSDSHIPSAPAASMNQFQIPKGQNPLRLPFASFRLIFGLEKTL